MVIISYVKLDLVFWVTKCVSVSTGLANLLHLFYSNLAVIVNVSVKGCSNIVCCHDLMTC